MVVTQGGGAVERGAVGDGVHCVRHGSCSHAVRELYLGYEQRLVDRIPQAAARMC